MASSPHQPAQELVDLAATATGEIELPEAAAAAGEVELPKAAAAAGEIQVMLPEAAAAAAGEVVLTEAAAAAAGDVALPEASAVATIEVVLPEAAAAAEEVVPPEAAAAATTATGEIEVVLPEAAAAAAGEIEVVLPEEAAAAAAGEGQAVLPEELQLDEGHQIVHSGERDTAGGNNNVHIGNRLACLRSLLTPPMLAGFFYAVIFLLAIVGAWNVRENRISYFLEQRRSGSCFGDRDCLAAEGVLTISLIVFLFYTVMFFSTVGTKTVQDCRNTWHCHFGCWLLKAPLLLACFWISVVVIPSGCIQLYGKAARFGSGAYLLIQLIGLTRFITRLNYKWCTNIKNHYIKVIMVSVLACSASIAGIIAMFIWYTGCRVNTILIGITVGLVGLMVLISLLLSKSWGFYIEPGLMGAYILFLCWSALKSEPDSSCFKAGKAGLGDNNWMTIIFFFGALFGVTYATVSTGLEGISLRNVAETAENDVPYGYGLFHFNFAMGCMYFGMLFVSWDTHQTTSQMWSMDVGHTSKWIHFSNELLAFIAFVAVVIARRYEIVWLRQLLGIIGAHQTEPEGSTADTVPPDEQRSETDNWPPPESREPSPSL